MVLSKLLSFFYGPKIANSKMRNCLRVKITAPCLHQGFWIGVIEVLLQQIDHKEK
jgi:hypothetical protein